MCCHAGGVESHCRDVNTLTSTNNSTLVVRWAPDPSRDPVATLVSVPPGDISTTVGDLADALGVGRRGLWIDGHSVSGVVPLHDCGLVVGSTISPWGAGSDDPPDARWELRVVAGPDAGATAPLEAGRTVVGSECARGTSAAVVVADPGMAPFHAAFEVIEGRGDGVALICVPLADRLAQRCSVPPAVPVRLAETVVWAVARPPDVPHDRGAVVGGRRVVRRPPRVLPGGGRSGRERHDGAPMRPTPPAASFERPTPHDDAEHVAAPPTAALIGSGVTVVLAAALGQPMLALFGLSGGVVAVATWGHARFGTRRRKRRLRSQRAAAQARLADDERTRREALATRERSGVVDLCECLGRIDRLDPRLWERRPDHSDTWTVVLGLGEHAPTPVDAPLHAVPVSTSLAPGTVLGLAGERAAVRGLARSLLVQAVANVGPADLTVRVVTDDVDEWAWVGWLPHCLAIDDVDSAGSGAPPPPATAVLTVVDSREPSRLEWMSSGDVVMVLTDSAVHLPAGCTALGTLSGSALRWHPCAADGLPIPVHAAGLRRSRAESAAARLAGLHDPECASSTIEGAVALADLVPDHRAGIVRAWDTLGPDPAPRSPLGVSSSGVVHLDLVRDGPHALVGGTTGAGKSELLRTLVVGLAASSPPEHLSFLLVDYKGGAAFDACERLPHVVGTVTDLDGSSAERALRSLHAELRRRERVMREHGVSDMAALRRVAATRPGTTTLARLVVVVDEFATLAAELPDFLSALIGVAQRGRSLGVHLVLATQRPGGVITDDIRANTNLRVALRVASTAEAVDVVGDVVPATFPRDRPGRAAVRLGHEELVIVQVASTQTPSARHPACPDLAGPDRGGIARRGVVVDAVPDLLSTIRSPRSPLESSAELDRLVDEIVAAAERRGGDAPTPPWCAPLPDRVTVEDLVRPQDHGVLDDPDAQTRRSLVWEPERGHLLVVGAVGSGCTSTLMVVAATAGSRVGPTVPLDVAPARPEVVVIDAVGDPNWDRVAPRLGPLVRITEVERLVRLVETLGAVLADRRRSTQGGLSPIVVVIDGVGALRSTLGDLDHELLDRFDRVLADGPGVGVVVAASATDVAAVPLGLVTRSTQRWILRLSDPLDGSLLGVPTGEVPDHRAPPGRHVALPERLTGQVVAPEAVVWPQSASPLTFGRLEPLAEVVVSDDLGGPVLDGRAVWVPLGIGWTDLTAVHVRCEPGENLLVVGPSRSGRSTVLEHLARTWIRASGDRCVVVLHGRAAAPLDLSDLPVEASPVDVVAVSSAADAVDALEEALRCDREVLAVVDDADRVEDPTGRLAAVLAAGTVASVVAGRTDGLRSAYGHWTSVVRRSRTGVVLGRLGHTDADVLGVVLPRRPGVPDAPGRGWLVVDGVPIDVVQTATAR
jgi:DNA segregation ATPase FtsK/SpoIIIE, S-DNA-T family